MNKYLIVPWDAEGPRGCPLALLPMGTQGRAWRTRGAADVERADPYLD